MENSDLILQIQYKQKLLNIKNEGLCQLQSYLQCKKIEFRIFVILCLFAGGCLGYLIFLECYVFTFTNVIMATFFAQVLNLISFRKLHNKIKDLIDKINQDNSLTSRESQIFFGFLQNLKSIHKNILVEKAVYNIEAATLFHFMLFFDIINWLAFGMSIVILSSVKLYSENECMDGDDVKIIAIFVFIYYYYKVLMILYHAKDYFMYIYQRKVVTRLKNQINNQEQIKYSQKQQVRDPFCIICLEPFQKNAILYKMVCCQVAFHQECLKDWNKMKENCPHCRRQCVLINFDEF